MIKKPQKEHKQRKCFSAREQEVVKRCFIISQIRYMNTLLLLTLYDKNTSGGVYLLAQYTIFKTNQ